MNYQVTNTGNRISASIFDALISISQFSFVYLDLEYTSIISIPLLINGTFYKCITIQKLLVFASS